MKHPNHKATNVSQTPYCMSADKHAYSIIGDISDNPASENAWIVKKRRTVHVENEPLVRARVRSPNNVCAESKNIFTNKANR